LARRFYSILNWQFFGQEYCLPSARNTLMELRERPLGETKLREARDPDISKSAAFAARRQRAMCNRRAS